MGKKEECSLYIGIDIGGTKCAVIRGGADDVIEEKLRFATTTKDETLERIFDAVAQLGPGKAIGVSCGGPLDEKRGLILSPPNLPGWDRVPLTELLTEKFGVPAKIRNDANACAVAEWKFGAGKGTENMVFMTFGTGLGAGLILNGRLYAGSTGSAGELGHIRLADFGPAGYGKCGSFEGFCSGGGLRELGQTMARSYVQRGSIPAFWKPDFTVADMAEAARAGDPCAREIFDTCGTMLGKGLAVVCDLLDPELILIGSVYARCRDLLEAPMEKIWKQETLSPITEHCRISVPALGEQIGDLAALTVAMEAANELY